MSPDAALAALATARTGLDEQEAGARLTRHGLNRMPEAHYTGPFMVFVRQFASPLIYLLLGAGALSLVLGDRWDAAFIFGVLFLNAAVGAFQEIKADASARALRALVPQTARVRRDGQTRTIDSSEIAPGDAVELESGMRVTADLRLIETQGLQLDESMLTGESMPVTKQADALIDHAAPVAERATIAHAGTAVVEGRGLGVAVGTGSRTALGEIGRTLDEAARAAADTPMVRRMAQLARQIAIGSVALILVLAALLALQGEGWREIALLAIALAVSAIPEGLPVAVTVALSAAAARMARRNVIVRALPAVEGLGACTLIASDKTGTLTRNRLTVEQIVLPDGAALQRGEWLDGRGPAGLAELGRAAGLCNEARLTGLGSPTGDAVDVALIDFARETGSEPAGLLAAKRLSIVPYESARRFAAVEAEYCGDTQIAVKGAPETVLPMCAGLPADIEARSEDLARMGYRVLALAEGRSHPGDGRIEDRLRGLRFLGFVGLADSLRDGAVEAVSKCREAGIGVRMITGDHPATAQAIARQLGLAVDDAAVVTGSELAALADDASAFRDRIRHAQVFARIEPAQKLAIVRTLEQAGEIVAVTGDGVNDGPALRAADIGIAMGFKGTDVARGAADLVLADDNFATIVAGVEEGRVTFSNIRKIVLFTLATGLAEIGMFLGALVWGLPMPLTPVQLLWLNLVTNGVQDVTLGFGRGEGDELRGRPRRGLASLIDRDGLMLMLPGALVMMVMSVWMLAGQLGDGASLADARNAVLLMVVLFQNAYLLSLRHLHLPCWRWHAPENGWLFLGLIAALALHVGAMHFPPLQGLLGLRPLSAELALQCFAGALLVLLVTEVTKRLVAR